jgi:tetratricopeptide (TPR) repeat protein
MTTLLLCLLVGTAAADDTDDARARELYDNGATLYDEGRYEDAIAAWEEAYRLSNRPTLLFNIAQAEERLGRYREALDHLNRYRAFASSNERETLDRRIANLERRLAEGESPTTTTTTNPVQVANPQADRPKARVLPWVFLGVGGASAVTGGVFAGLAGADRSEAKGLCVDGGGNVYCPTEAASALGGDRRNSLIADIAFGVAGAGVLGGVLTFVLPVNTSVGATWLPGGGAVSLGGRF